MPKSQQGIIDALRALLLRGVVGTQEEMCQLLAAEGYPVTQSKLSRLLRRLNAVKAKNEAGEIVYRLPREPAPSAPTSQLVSLIGDITANETTVVIHTSPGSAQLIARLLDYHKDRIGILATIAGDDAIMVIPKSIAQTGAIRRAINKVLFAS